MINCCRKHHRKKRKVGFADVVDRACKHRVVDPPPCLLLRTSSVIHVNPPKRWKPYRKRVGHSVSRSTSDRPKEDRARADAGCVIVLRSLHLPTLFCRLKSIIVNK